MRKPLTESEREELLDELTKVHDVVSTVVLKLRRRYSAKTPAVKAAAKAERGLFQLKRDLIKMDLEEAPVRTTLPEVRRGEKVVDLDDL